ncbi:hypothetical protein B0J13DRAFT_576202 [Dactylonectria estremocensis]|uniref:Uncharacterized protein n=1 Tax=Dactylonectria estremocensis TaxID=1079267 RepID=A0A9P9D1U7_9HYPO|nr:hypothetical protein B0J13DRAFT_576202 [Dactylonectria estremocensis]
MPATRSISFDEVFQGGKAPFILRCDEHDHDFMYPPLRGAAAHLRSKKHGWLRNPSNAVIVEHFGIEVLNCNAELAEKNNSISFKVGQGSMKRSISRIADGMPGRRTSGSEKRLKRHEGISSPIPGRIYLAYWEMTKDWLPALLLPYIGLEEFGVLSTLESIGLTDYIPECYDYDLETKDLKWKKGYEHGGPCVMEWEFPVLYFDGNKFPDGSPADWVRAGDLQDLDVFDASPRLVPNLKFAKNYLRRRIEKEADTASESATALSEIESDSGTTSSSCVAGKREVSSLPSMESEISLPDSQLEHANQNCWGNALEPDFDTRSQMAVPEVNYRTTIEDEVNYEIESSSGVARIRSPVMSISIDLNQLEEEPAAESFSQERETSLTLSVQLEVLSQDPRLKQRDRSCYESASEPKLGSALNVERAISTDACLHMADPEVISISSSEDEMSDKGQLNREPNDSITDTNLSKTSQSGTFHTLQPKPPITASDPTGRPQVAIPRDADDRTTFVTLSKTQAPKPQTLQVPTAHIPSVNTNVVKTSHLGTLHLIRDQSSLRSPDKPPVKPLVRVPFPHNIQLQTGRPRFGQPPHEVPPYFLNRLRELTGSQDENPLISAFLTKGIYLCPWCQRQYYRAVSFTDHLQGPIVSRAGASSTPAQIILESRQNRAGNAGVSRPPRE